jgi:hypothetical protein
LFLCLEALAASLHHQCDAAVDFIFRKNLAGFSWFS